MLIYLFILHFIADFILQSREMGTKKSSELVWLVRHLFIIQCVFSVGFMPIIYMGMQNSASLEFITLNTLVHGLVDWNIWKLYKLSAHKRILKECKKFYEDHALSSLTQSDLYQSKVKNFKYWEDHLFYTTIGLDQLLHAITILALYQVVLK